VCSTIEEALVAAGEDREALERQIDAGERDRTFGDYLANMAGDVPVVDLKRARVQWDDEV
jgi:hypothetical protein